MRRKIHRSLRNVSPVHRRAFRPVLGWLEERTLLSGSPTYYTVNLTSDTDASSGTDATTGDPSGDLLWAVEQANANSNPCGSVINFDPSVFATAQTITLSSTLELSESPGPEVIDATGIAGKVIISGNNQVGVVQLDGGVTATLNGLTITGGSAAYGGGIFTQSYTILTLSNSTLTGNTATNSGGALYNSFQATVIDSDFLDNTSTNGNGGAIDNARDGFSLSVNDSTFTGNSAGNGAGGAIYNDNYGGVTTLSSDAFSNNTAGQGGGLSNNEGTTMSLTGCSVSDNTATSSGGGILNNGGTLTVTTSTIAGNTAPNGSGGGIDNQGTLTLTDSTVCSNSSFYGGGLFNDYGTAVIESSTFSGNSAGYGGGIFTVANLTVVNSTIADNEAGSYGGAIYDGGGTLTVVNSTIAYNSSYGYGGGGIWNESGTPAALDNTIVAENDLNGDGDDLNSRGGGGGFTGSNNLVGYDATGTLSSSGDNLLGVGDPGIGRLGNNGGPTQTIALLAGSPAIGAGSVALAVDPSTNQPLAYDQRGAGFPRIVNGTVDIGAFERPTTIGSPTVYTVTDASNSTSDTGSLPYAIAQSDTNPNLAGSIIEFDPTVFSASTPQTITLTGTLELSEPSGPITINGPGSGALTVNGNNTGSVFQVNTDVVASLSGLTISGGSAGDGGGILTQDYVTLTLSDSILSDNSASYGGALLNSYEATVINSVFQNNTAVSGGQGGAIYNDGILCASGSTFTGNSANSGPGGAIFNYGAGTLSNDVISNNTAALGGGVGNDYRSTLSISGCTISDNTANTTNSNSGGGGIWNAGNLAITTSTITGNSASDYQAGGGGIDNQGTLCLTDSTISDNTGGQANAATGGGGIANAGTAVIEGCTLAGNSASLGGGIANSATLTVVNSTIADNQGGYGGGIVNFGGTLTVVNSTLADNTSGEGGGIIDFGGTLTVVNSTIAYNTSADNGNPGGGIWTQAPVTLNNTIVAENNPSGNGDDLDGQGNGTFTGSNNLVVYDATGTLNSSDNLLGVDPGLGLLANNGGPTQTIALLAGSPAIDAGSVALAVDPTTNQPLVYDQRGAGYPRIVNGTVDIGAFERPTTIGSPPVYTVTDASNSCSDTGSLPYAVAQADANVNLAGSIIQFDPSVFSASTPQTITLTGTLELSEPSGPITINGPGAGALTINGNSSGSVFQVDTDVVASLSGLTITGGLADGGGGILAQDFVTLTLCDSTLSDNSASYGGALLNSYEATVINSVFLNNTVSSGGQGGAIFNGGILSVSGSTFTGNSASNTGDGGAIINYGTATLSSDAFSNNTALHGGALFNNGGGSSLSLSDSTITGNSVAGAAYGGGIYNSGTLTISTSTIGDNEAINGSGYGGGGIFNNGTLTLTDSTLSGNYAYYYGGGLLNYGTAVLEDSTVAGNSGYQGGGLYNQGSLTVVNSTIASNSAGSAGGGIDNPGGQLTVVNSTIAYNTTGSGQGGGGIWNQSGTPATLDNTIVVENDLNGYGDDLNTRGGGFVGSNNLVGYDATGTLSSSDNLLNVTDPGIGLLADNGGPTQTIALLAGSPAIDAGSVALAVDPTTGQSLAYDQRGVGYPRIVAGMVDIGAYEGPDPTTTTVTTSTTPSVYGEPVTFTATVTATPPLSGTAISPTGTVTFYDGTTLLGTGTLNARGVAAYETTALQLSVGSNQSITAVYGGDANYNTSTSSVLSQTVCKDSTTTTILPSSANPSVSGQSVTFTADVSASPPGSGTPTGTVTFYDNGTSIGSGMLSVVNGQDQASFTTSTLSTAGHPITAAYTSGDGNFNASLMSSAITQVVNKASTSTTVISSGSPSVSGQAVIFTATVSVTTPGSTAVASPTGTVTFYNNGSSIGTGMLSIVNGLDQATFSTSTLSTASHSITAAYTNGDGNFNASLMSSAITQTVNKASTSTTVATSGSPSIYGQSVTFTATVSVVGPGSTAVAYPSGTVTFYDGGTSIGTGMLSVVSGHDQATFSTSALSTSTHSITAAYTGGDGNFTASAASPAISQVVNKDNTTTTAVASPSSANLGQTVTFTATVTANSPGSGTPTGTVDFYDTTTSTDLTPGGVALSSGAATFSTTSLAAGPHTIKATYSGDGNFLTSFGTAGTVTVGQSIIVLDPSAGGALSISGNASINLPGGVFVNSSSSTALSASGNAAIKATVIDVHGGVQKSGNASFSPAPTTGAPIAADPYSSLASPSTSGLTNYGSENLSGNSSATIKPGIYSAISASGNATLTLSTGLYLIEGGGFTISGNASVSGTGVTIFNAGGKYPTTGGTYGSISLSGNGSYNLTPPTSGTCAGIVIFQSRDNTKALTISGNASGMTGTIYAPAAQLSESGNAELNASIDVDTLSISGNGVNNTVTLDAPSGAVAYTPAQIRAAYGISALALDGTGQTIAIVDAYDDPDIFQAVDTFDSQFGLTGSGPTLYAQYGPASS
ncbi:MAG: Ig-like domain repeat protein, partial [Isosphaeraceae bacterium]